MRYLALVKKWRSNTLQVVDKRIHQIPLLAHTLAGRRDTVQRGEGRRSPVEGFFGDGRAPVVDVVGGHAPRRLLRLQAV